MAFTNDEKQEIKTIVQEVIGEQADPIDDTTQVDALEEGDVVPIVRSEEGVNGYRKAPVELFGGSGGSVTVDSALSTTSKNPVQNKVVTAALNGKQPTLIGEGAGQNIKTIGGQSLLGTGDIPMSGGGGTGTVTGAKVGSGDPITPDGNGIIALPNYERDAQKNVKPNWDAQPGSAAEILNKPTIPAEQIQSDWNQNNTSAKDYIWNKPGVFGASGQGHSAGLVPDPGIDERDDRYLREDGTWHTPPSGGGSGTVTGVKVGESGRVIAPDNNGVVQIPDYEEDAEKNIKPDWDAVEGSLAEILNKPSAFSGSGSGHKGGLVPDPGASAGAVKFLNENGSWVKPDTKDMVNGAGFITGHDIPEGAAASNTPPKMDGDNAAAGTEMAFARGDHQHPHDSTKSDKASTVTAVEYDSDTKKLTKTINGSVSEIITVSALKTEMGLGNVTNDSQVKRSEMGAANGVATLGSDGKVPSSQIPAAPAPVLTPGCLLDTVDNYVVNDYIGQWCQQNVKGSAYLYDIGNVSKVYYSATGNHTPRNIRLLWYDKDLFFIDKTTAEIQSEYNVPSGAVYVSFVLYYDETEIAHIEDGLPNISFSFLGNDKIYIDKDMKYPHGESGSYSINLDDYSNTYIEGEFWVENIGTFYNDGRGKSICIPYSLFKDYDYLEVKPTNNTRVTRVHFLKKEPKVNEEQAEYSDFYKENCQLNSASSSVFLKIPDDARYIMVYAFYGDTDHRPQKLALHTSKDLKLDNMSDWDEKVGTVWRNPNQYQLKLLHWNIGNYSNGGMETSIDDSNYTQKLASFKAFIEKYKDHNIVINEWNDVFARLSGGNVYAGPALWDYGYDYQHYIRNNQYDELGCVPTNTQVAHKVGVFNSMIGMQRKDDYYATPRPYVIYRHYIGGGSLYVMHTHMSTNLTQEQTRTVFAEMVSIMSGYSNVVICGDLNNKDDQASMDVFRNAGYTVANNSEYTYPYSSTTGQIYDWFVYKGYFTNVSFKVCKDAVDQGYSDGDTSHMLSDHWPIALSLTYTGSSIVPGVKGAYRYNPATNEPEWHNGEEWVAYGSGAGGGGAYLAFGDIDWSQPTSNRSNVHAASLYGRTVGDLDFTKTNGKTVVGLKVNVYSVGDGVAQVGVVRGFSSLAQAGQTVTVSNLADITELQNVTITTTGVQTITLQTPIVLGSGDWIGIGNMTNPKTNNIPSFCHYSGHQICYVNGTQASSSYVNTIEDKYGVSGYTDFTGIDYVCVNQVNKIKIGDNSYTASGDTIEIPAYEQGAEPTSAAKVKAALGVVSGGARYLKEDGSWDVPAGGGGGTQKGTKVYLDANGGNLPALTSQNVVYVISYGYDLNGGSVTVPSGCALEFAGGSINGGTLVLDNTYLYGNIKFGTSITVSGTCKNATAYQKWFSGNNVDAWHRFINNVDGPGCYEYEFGTYSPTVYVNKEVENKGSVNINGNNATLTFSYTQSAKAFAIKPKNADTYRSASISSAVNKGDTQITVSSASNLNVGDVISVRDNTEYSFSPHRSSYKHCEFATIMDISGDTLTLTHPLFGSYQHTGSINVYAYNHISCNVRDLVLNVSSPSSVTAAFTGLEITQAIGGRLANVKSYDFKTCVRFYSSMNIDVEDCICKVTATQASGTDSYGLAFANCQNASVIGGDFVGGNHAVTIGGADNSLGVISREILVKNIRAKSIKDGFPAAIDMHGNAEFITIEGCTTAGVYFRGKNNNLLNNFVYDSDISCSEFASFNHVISGNLLKNARISVVGSDITDRTGWIKDGVEDIFVIRGNKSYDCPSIPSSYLGTGTVKPELRFFVTSSISAEYYNIANTTIVVDGNDIHNGVINLTGFSTIKLKDNSFTYDSDMNTAVRSKPKLTCTKLFIEGNKFIGYGHNPYYVGSASYSAETKTWSYSNVTADYVYIKNNHIESSSADTPLFEASTSAIIDLYIEGNIVTDKFILVNQNVGKAIIRNNTIEPTVHGVNISSGETALVTKAFVMNNLVTAQKSIIVWATTTIIGRNVNTDTMALQAPKTLSGTTVTNLDAGGGGGSEPSAYIKAASVSQDGNTLTLTNKDNTTVTFSPSGSSPTPQPTSNGVYIEATDGTLVESTNWATAGKTANSILIVDGTWRRRIYIDESYETGVCFAGSWDVSGCTNDTDGSVNTATLRSLGSKPAIVAATFTVGGDTYLPAKQEMTDIFTYLTEINACRTALGKSALPTGNYWSSTYRSYDGSKYYLYIVNTDGTNTKGGGSSNAYYYIRVGKY